MEHNTNDIASYLKGRLKSLTLEVNELDSDPNSKNFGKKLEIKEKINEVTAAVVYFGVQCLVYK